MRENEKIFFFQRRVSWSWTSGTIVSAKILQNGRRFWVFLPLFCYFSAKSFMLIFVLLSKMYSWVCNNRVVYNKSALWGNFGKYKRPALEVVIINVLDHMSCKYYKCLAWNNCLGLQWMSCTKHWFIINVLYEALVYNKCLGLLVVTTEY